MFVGSDTANAFKWNPRRRTTADHRVESTGLSRNFETFCVFGEKTEPANATAVPGHIWPPPLMLFSLPDLLRKGTDAPVRAAQKVRQLPVSTLPSGLFLSGGRYVVILISRRSQPTAQRAPTATMPLSYVIYSSATISRQMCTSPK